MGTVCGVQDQCEPYLGDISYILREVLQVDLIKLQCGQRLLAQEKVAVAFVPNKFGGRLQKAHPCPEPSVSVVIPLRNGLGPENGMWKIYPGSHKIQTEEELRASGIIPKEIRVGPTEALVIAGGLWMETSEYGGGTFMWLGFSEIPVGLYFSKYTLWFIIASHGGDEGDWASPEGIGGRILSSGRQMIDYSTFYSRSGST